MNKEKIIKETGEAFIFLPNKYDECIVGHNDTNVFYDKERFICMLANELDEDEIINFFRPSFNLNSNILSVLNASVHQSIIIYNNNIMI